jgi:hypothetical protein
VIKLSLIRDNLFQSNLSIAISNQFILEFFYKGQGKLIFLNKYLEFKVKTKGKWEEFQNGKMGSRSITF